MTLTSVETFVHAEVQATLLYTLKIVEAEIFNFLQFFRQ